MGGYLSGHVMASPNVAENRIAFLLQTRDIYMKDFNKLHFNKLHGSYLFLSSKNMIVVNFILGKHLKHADYLNSTV